MLFGSDTFQFCESSEIEINSLVWDVILLYNSFFEQIRRELENSRVLRFCRICIYTPWSDFYLTKIITFTLLPLSPNKYYININYLTKKIYPNKQYQHNFFHMAAITLHRSCNIKIASMMTNITGYFFSFLLRLSFLYEVVNDKCIRYLFAAGSNFNLYTMFHIFLSELFLTFPSLFCTT